MIQYTNTKQKLMCNDVIIQGVNVILSVLLRVANDVCGKVMLISLHNKCQAPPHWDVWPELLLLNPMHPLPRDFMQWGVIACRPLEKINVGCTSISKGLSNSLAIIYIIL